MAELFGIERVADMIVCSSDGEEVEDDDLLAYFAENPRGMYTVLDEYFLERSDHQHTEQCAWHSHGQGDEHKHCIVECELSQHIATRFQAMPDARRAMARSVYQPRHPWLFESPLDLKRVLAPELLALYDADSKTLRSVNELATCVTSNTRLYSLPCFNADFCATLLEEVDAFEASGCALTRPNSMNVYGLILDDIGLRAVLAELRERIVAPLAQQLLTSLPGVDSIDHHHAFVVQYAASDSQGAGDTDLGFHYDESEATLNVCLGREGFKGR